MTAMIHGVRCVLPEQERDRDRDERAERARRPGASPAPKPSAMKCAGWLSRNCSVGRVRVITRRR